MTTAATQPDYVRAAIDLLPDVLATADETERGRRLAPAMFDKLLAAGLFDLVKPRALGGAETDITTMVRVIEEISVGDGATGWCAGIGLGTSIISAYLPLDVGKEMFTHGVVTGGAMAPLGRAEPVDGGYRVSGRWPFASGCDHCAYIVGGSMVFENGQLRTLPGGFPDWRTMVFRRDELEIIDTWHVQGLRGTGSHDITVKDVFIPEERALSLLGGKLAHDGPLYRFPAFGLLALTVAPVAIGIARHAIDEFRALAASKTPVGGRSALKDREVVQNELGRAAADVRSARAFMYEVTGEVWDTVAAGDRASTEQRAMLRMACGHAALASAKAVDRVYELAGTTPVYNSSILQRCFRDAHTATQHVMLNAGNYTTAGQMLLGIEPQLFSL